MGANSNIECTSSDDGSRGYTWNPVDGCTRVSEGCRNCYIEPHTPFRVAHRRFDGARIGATTSAPAALLSPGDHPRPLVDGKPISPSLAPGNGIAIRRVGKKRAGRVLDVRIWEQFPVATGAEGPGGAEKHASDEPVREVKL